MAEFALPKTHYRHSSKDEAGEPFSIQCPPTLVPGATITFCGESPGRQEVLERKGFVGGSGNVLWRMCKQAGIDPDRVNRTNVCKRRPPGDNFGIFYHDPRERTKETDELRFWRELLTRELQHHTPNVFVACGDEALRAVCPENRGISKWRGSIIESSVIKGMKVIPIMHPSWIMKMNWEWYYIGIRDLKRVAAEAKSKARVLKEPEPKFIIGPKIGQALEWLDYIADHPNEEWCFDIETRGDTITCFAVSVESEPESAICIPIHTTHGPYWTEAEEMAVWRGLDCAFVCNPNCLNQNLAYDIDYMLEPYGIEPSGYAFDTMIAHKLAFPEFDKGLDFTTSIYTYQEYYKDEGKTWKKSVPDQRVWVYNCKDVWITPKVAKAIRTSLREQGLERTYAERAHRFIPIALEMQRNRLRVNHDWHQKLAGWLEEERAKTHSELSRLTGIREENLNVKSSPQIAKILYEDLRLPVKRKRGSDKASTEETLLKELRATLTKGSHAHTVINKIIEERHLRTRQSNYINVTLDPDGFWPFMVQINNDKTGRWESTRSPKWRGCKVGHIPKAMRLMFEPPEGRIFCQRDLSQAEARYVGAEARCLFLTQTFADFDAGRGPKIHKKVGKLCWGVEPKSDSIQYDASKRIVHAYDYMMGYKKLAITANLSEEEAKKVYGVYGSNVPEIPRWHTRIKDEATRNGYLLTPTGRRRQCFSACGMVTNTGALADEIWRDLVSWKPQTTIPDILNEGLFRTWENLDYVRVHQQGHDSHLDSIPPEKLAEYYELTELYHRVPFIIDNEIEVVIPSEMQWGYLWGALKPYEPGDRGTREEWSAWCEKEKVFDEATIKEKLYAIL